MKIASAILAFSYNITLAKCIGVDSAGIYFIAFSVSSFAIVFSSLGLNNPLVKFTATNFDNNDWSKVKGVSKISISLALIVSLLLTLLIYISAPYMSIYYFQNQSLTLPIRIMSFVIIPMTIISLIQEIYKGLGKYKHSLIFAGIIVPCISIPLLLILTKSYSLNGALAAFLFSNIVTLIIGLYTLYKYFKSTPEVIPSFNYKLLIKTSLPFLMIAITNIIINQGDVILLGMSSSTAEIGAYAIAKKISALILFLLLAVNTISAPKFAAYFKSEKYDELKKTAQYFSSILILFTTPIVIIIVVFSEHLLSVLGSDFSGYGNLLTIFIIAQFINVGSGSVGTILNMTGYEKTVRNYSIFLTFFTILISLISIKFYNGGLIEIAIIFSLNIIVKNILGIIYVKKYHGFYIVSLSQFRKTIFEMNLVNSFIYKYNFLLRRINSKKRKTPNFLIIGAQKGGTTSLYDYLVQHPDINSSFRKEVHFFDQNFHRGINWYRSFFPLNKTKGITGEATPLYLFHPSVPNRVAKSFPNIKLIVLLRNPVDRAYSHYKMEVREKRESLAFKDAVDIESKRLKDEKIINADGSLGKHHQNHSYLERGIYVEQLNNWFKYFPRNQFLILKSEDLFLKPKDVYDRVLDFLEVSEYGSIDFKALNSDKSKAKIDPKIANKISEYFHSNNLELYDSIGEDFKW